MPLSWTVLLYAVASLWPKLDYNVACTNASKLFNLSQFFWELDNLRNYFLVFRRCIPLVSQHNRPPSDSEMWLLIGPLRYWIVNSDETLGLPSYLYGGQVNACAEALKKSACLQASAFEHILMKISVRKNEKKNKKIKNQNKKKYRLKKFSLSALLNENIKLCLNISWLTDTCRPLPLKNYISRCRVILWGGSVSDRTDWSALYLSYLCSNTDIAGFCTSLLSLCLFPYCLVPAATYY